MMETPSPPSQASDTLSSDHYRSGRDSIEHLLDYGSSTRYSESPSYGPRKRIGLAALLPLATILFWSFGMGSALPIWLLSKRIPAVPGVFDGFIIVDEGNKTGSTQMLDGQRDVESKMRGLLIINAISLFSSVVVLPLMALGAFYVAAQWLDGQANSKDGPTPLQFGLIMKMCSTGTWTSVLATVRYLFRHRSSRTSKSIPGPPVSPVMYRALSIASVVVFLHYAVKATDLWLTADLGSAYYSRISQVPSSTDTASELGTRQNINISPEAYRSSFLATMEPNWTWGRNNATGDNYHYQGLDTMTGRSLRNHIASVRTNISSSLRDTASMAVIVRPPSGVPFQWSWTASTIGVALRCQPAPCDAGGQTMRCPIPSNIYPSIPLPSFQYMSTPGSEKRNNATSYDSTTGMDSSIDWGLPSPLGTNPSYVVVQLNLDSSEWDSRIDTSELGGTVVDEKFWYLFYIGACEITLYDVEVSFTGSASSGSNGDDANFRYKLASPPVPMSNDRTTLLLAPILAYIPQGVNNYHPLLALVRRLQNRVSDDTLSPGFSNRVSAEFAKLLLAPISSMCETIPAKTVISNAPQLVSRYPTLATLSYVGVVYAHGLLAIILFLGIVGRSSRSIVVDDPGWRVKWHGELVREKEKPVQELILVHSRLTDPLAIIAEHFPEPDSDDTEGSEKKKRDASLSTHTSAGVLSARRRPIEMFGVESANTMHVEVGLLDDREGRRRFGMKQRVRLAGSPDNGSRV